MNLYEVARFLEAHDNYDILTHAYPDGDTLGSGFALCLALRQIGKKARVITTGVPSKFTYLQKKLRKKILQPKRLSALMLRLTAFSVQIWANISARLICALTTTVQTHLPLRKSLLTNMRRQTAKFSTSCFSECTSTLQRTLPTASTQAFQPTPAVSDTQTQPPKPCVLPQVLWTLAVTPHT